MKFPPDYQWLKWATDLQAIAQSGLTYAEGEYDKERYRALNAIAAEILAEHSQLDEQTILNELALESGYATPKIGVRGAVFVDNKILLVKERSDGLWSIPGGWADINYSPTEVVIKEIFEETGFTAKPLKLLAFYDKQKHPHPPEFRHIYECVFLCEITGGSLKTSYETLEVDFFAEDQIPPLSLKRVLPQQIQRFFAHLRHPEWPTDFD